MSTITKKAIVNQPVEVVWKMITNPNKFHALRIPHIYENSATDELRAGSVFEGRSLTGGGTWQMYVIDCIRYKEFSFGSKKETWDFHYQLNSQNSKTIVKFSRRFNTSLTSMVLDAITNTNKRQLTEDTVNSLKEACHRMLAGKNDGLTES